jgi:hypothetical protein
MVHTQITTTHKQLNIINPQYGAHETGNHALLTKEPSNPQEQSTERWSILVP